MRNYNNHLSFIDLLMNALAVFAMLFIFCILQINKITPETPPIAAPVDGKALIIMTWDDKSPDDIDLWLKTPEPDKIGYKNSSGNIANLERDDLGVINDQYRQDNQVGFINSNREVIMIRKMIDGEYIVNVHFFQRHQNPIDGSSTTGPIEVTIQLIVVEPSYKEVIQKKITLDRVREEKTAFIFNVTNDQITNIDFRQVPFLLKKLDEPEVMR